jgi:hypothetical protein
MKAQKLNQIKPRTFPIGDLRFMNLGLQAGDGRWFANAGGRPKRQRAGALQDAGALAEATGENEAVLTDGKFKKRPMKTQKLNQIKPPHARND